jgi:hypothetical protein
VLRLVDLVVILEIDEKAHRFYEVRCEQTRMLQIHEAIGAAGVTAPVLFVRFNPDGKVVRDGHRVRVPYEQRIERLTAFLGRLQSGRAGALEDPFNLAYLFYSTAGGLPTVTEDPDYAAEMKGAIRYCE